MSRLTYSRLLPCLLGLILSACGESGDDSQATTAEPAEPGIEPASLVLRGGKIATVDPNLGNVEAIAVTGTR